MEEIDSDRGYDSAATGRSGLGPLPREHVPYTSLGPSLNDLPHGSFNTDPVQEVFTEEVYEELKPFQVEIGIEKFMIGYGTTAVNVGGKFIPVVSKYDTVTLSYTDRVNNVFTNLAGLKEVWVVFNATESEIFIVDDVDDAGFPTMDEDDFAVHLADLSFDATGDDPQVIQHRTGHIEIGGGGGETACQLGNLSEDAVNSVYPPDPSPITKYKIESGYVHGGGTSVLLAKDDITAVIGDKLYIKMDWTAQTTNGVLLVTGTMTGQSIEQGVSVPADDVITVLSLTGSHYRLLGEWTDDGEGNPVWVNDSCGAYTFSFCNGIFTGYRGNPTINQPYYYY